MALTNLQANITLDVYDHDGAKPSIKTIALDDNTRYVLANIRSRGEVYDIGSSATVQLIVIRPDKVGVQIAGQAQGIEIGQEDESVVTVYGAYAELDQAAIVLPGTLLGQFKITSGDQILRTQIFQILNGEALDSDTWAGDYDGYNLDELVADVAEAVEKVGDLETDVAQIKEDLQDLRYAYEIPLRRCYFVRKAWMNSSNGFVDDNSRATNSIPITINSPVKIVSDNANVQFAIMQNSSYILDDWTDSVELSGLDGAYINMRVVSGAEMTGTLVDALHIYTTETGYKDFVQNYTYTIKNTDRFPSYSEYVGVNRYATDLSANNVGCLLRNSSVQSSTFPFICDKDVTVWVGRYNGQTLTVIIDGVATTISEGKSFTIPANTYFTCYWNASAGSKSECTMYVTEYEVGERLLNPTMAGSQMLTNATTSQSIDTSFMVGDKVFMLAQETGGYAVKNGNAFTKSAQSIGNTLGHANSCNYDAVNKKVYVSDWRDNPNTIYVLTVDTDQDTLTYEKTLTVPLASGRGSTEYFVFDDEKQIYFVGWKTGAAGTDPHTLMYGLYVLTTTGYELAWERQAVRPLILQSAIVHKHYIYIMECQMDYKTVGISRINMLTGEMEHNACTMAGSFVTYEGEGLTPIGDHAFVTSDHNGRTYFIGFSPKAR